ncbi:MAG: hypothetical protein DA405_13660 [Bacteroidetes bacterium]|nr:MAG: hypothetical protein DA405_13660 [Bacteroidota bacterium]
MDTVNTHEETVEDGQHTLDMLEKAEGLDNPEASDRPEWLPEKFNSVEDMAQAYNSLEQKLGSQDEEEYEEELEDDELESIVDGLEEEGIDFDSLSQEFAELGGLTEDSYDSLVEAGIPRSMVDQFIDGQMAVATQMQQEAFEQVGGQEAYEDMVSWASDNMQEASIDAFNNAVNSGNIETANLAIQGLHAQYRSVNGSEPSLVMGETKSVTGGVFDSAAQLTQAMRDPRYESDSAYRQQVASKLSRSNIL